MCTQYYKQKRESEYFGRTLAKNQTRNVCEDVMLRNCKKSQNFEMIHGSLSPLSISLYTHIIYIFCEQYLLFPLASERSSFITDLISIRHPPLWYASALMKENRTSLEAETCMVPKAASSVTMHTSTQWAAFAIKELSTALEASRQCINCLWILYTVVWINYEINISGGCRDRGMGDI